MAASSNELDELRKDVQQYKPGSEVIHPDEVIFPKHLHIGLFGMTGCGKSSLINSIKFAAAGDLKKKYWVQIAPQLKAGGHNLYRRAVHISSGICVVDNRGLDKPSTDNALREIAAQLDGKRRYAKVVEWQENKREEEEFGANAISGDIEYAIGCVVLVFSAGHDIEFSTAGLKKVVDLVHKHQGGYPLAVITNVDRNKRSRVEQLRNALEVNGVSDIFQVANITQENEKLEETYQHSLLSLLGRCMVCGDESYIFKHHLKAEGIRVMEMMRAQKGREQQWRMEEQRRAKQHEDKEVQELNVAMQKMKVKKEDTDRYVKAIGIAECNPTSNVTVTGHAEKDNSAETLAAIGGSATTGAVLGSFAGPPGAVVGAAAGAFIGGLMAGVRYLSGQKK